MQPITIEHIKIWRVKDPLIFNSAIQRFFCILRTAQVPFARYEYGYQFLIYKSSYINGKNWILCGPPF